MTHAIHRLIQHTLLMSGLAGLIAIPANAQSWKPDRTVESDFVLETIATRMPYESYEKVFNTFIRWARFGELFIYDERIHRLALPPISRHN